MKTSLLLGLIIVTLGLAGCQNATSDTTDAVVGKWNGTGSAAGLILTVAAGNTWVGSGTSTGSGTWSKTGSTYTVIQTSVTPNVTMTATISGTTLTLISGTTTYTFSKG